MERALVLRCRVERGQPFGRADFEKPLTGDAGPQALPPREIPLDRVEAAGLAEGQRGDDVAPEGGRAVVDVVERRVGLALLVAEHPRAGGSRPRSRRPTVRRS